MNDIEIIAVANSAIAPEILPRRTRALAHPGSNDHDPIPTERRDTTGFRARSRSAAAAGAAGRPRTGAAAEPVGGPVVHRFAQTEPFPVNAYIIEGSAQSVVIDATLTNAASRALRRRVDEIGKPLAAVLLTHPHPDHYAGIGNLVAGLDVPILAVAGVDAIVRRDDALKNEMVGPMFGDAWPTNRVFPTDVVADGEVLRFDDIELEVRDIGPAESFHDSMFVLRGAAPQPSLAISPMA